MGGTAVQDRERGIDADLEVSTLRASGILGIKTADSHNNLDPMENIDVLPAAVGVESELFVLGHHLASRDLYIGLDLCRAPDGL
jgi:hypothetical protein